MSYTNLGTKYYYGLKYKIKGIVLDMLFTNQTNMAHKLPLNE